MLKLGAVGAQSSHLGHFARELGGDAQIVRVLPIDADAAAVPAGIDVSDDTDGFAAGLDGVLILTRDGRKHKEQALPFLERGLPVFVDKPLACDLGQAEDILAAGRVASFSTLRFLPEVEALRANATAIRRISVPANGADPNAGFWFLGIHAAELACTLVGNCDVERVAFEGSALAATLRSSGGPLELVLAPATAGYRIEHAEGAIDLDAGLAYTFGAHQLERFFAGDDVLGPEQMVAPIALLEQVLSRVPARAQPGFASAT